MLDRRTPSPTSHDDLVDHLVRTTPLQRGEAARVVSDVLAYFDETTEEFVRRRHRELQSRGLANAEIFERIADELPHRAVAPPRALAATAAPHRLRLRRTPPSTPEHACTSSTGSREERPMCGIVGYIGRRDVAPLLLEGLQRLEYRGYDSAGVVDHRPSRAA